MVGWEYKDDTFLSAKKFFTILSYVDCWFRKLKASMSSLQITASKCHMA